MLIKSIRRTLLIVSLLVFVPDVLLSQVSSTLTSIGIDAKVIAPISLLNSGSSRLNFGTISRSSTSGTVTVPVTGDRTSTGGVGVLVSSSFSRAAFTVTGENNSSFNISLPANGSISLTRVGNSDHMPVNDFQSSVGTTSVLSGTGTASFEVGATLTVSGDQAAGDYTGSFPITVAYQ